MFIAVLTYKSEMTEPERSSRQWLSWGRAQMTGVALGNVHSMASMSPDVFESVF